MMEVGIARPVHETRFAAMGTDAHLVVVDGPERLLGLAAGRIRELEQRWSRFRPESELSRLNGATGRPTLVSADTFALISAAVEAWRATGGRFDPTVGPALIAHGYDRDFRLLADRVAPVGSSGPAPTPSDVDLVPALPGVTLPVGVTIDPGGIGKGLAADLTARTLAEAGAGGALVNLGGDLRAVGRAPDDEGWVVSIPDPLQPDHELARLSFAEGAVATSSTLRRRWATDDGPAHHLIDPATGRPAEVEVVAATVVAAEAWWAEALATLLLLSGPDGLSLLDEAEAVVVAADGTRHATPGMEAALR